MFRATRISMGGDDGDRKARSRSATVQLAERNEHDRAAPQPFKFQMASHGVHAAHDGRWFWAVQIGLGRAPFNSGTGNANDGQQAREACEAILRTIEGL